MTTSSVSAARRETGDKRRETGFASAGPVFVSGGSWHNREPVEGKIAYERREERPSETAVMVHREQEQA